MANFDDFFDDQENENEDNVEYFRTGALRDSTIFLVDCTTSMFNKYENTTYFQKCMKAIQNMYLHKIYGSDKDLLSVIFFGTDKHNTENDFLHIFILQDLEQPSAERIKQLDSFTSDAFDYENFKKTYGHSDDYSLENVFWCCSDLFSKIKRKLDTKRIMLFTRNDHPHSKNKSYERLAKNRARDLYEVPIALELVPVLSTGETFDYTKFYDDILMLSDEQVKQLPDPVEEFKELERTIRSKDHKKRPYLHLNLSLSDDLFISCSVFNLIRPCPKPSKVKLDKATNMETKTVTRRYVPDTGEILFPSDMKLAIDVCDKRVTFEQDEVKTIKRFKTPGLRLLGFKSISLLKPHIFVKPGHFIYPDETRIEGSATLFRALLEKCLEKDRFILCECIPRVNTPPRLVALVPQAEELDGNKIQVMPPGFHAIYLPYADDFREIERKVTAKADENQINAFKLCIKKLRFTYTPEDFKSPTIQKIWNEIEAIALEKEKPEEVVDLTIPDLDNIRQRAGKYLDEFKDVCSILDSDLSTNTKRKNEKNDTENGKKQKIDNSLDIENVVHTDRLTKYTVPQLKEFAKSKKIKVNGTRKQDFIDAINSFYS